MHKGIGEGNKFWGELKFDEFWYLILRWGLYDYEGCVVEWMHVAARPIILPNRFLIYLALFIEYFNIFIQNIEMKSWGQHSAGFKPCLSRATKK